MRFYNRFMARNVLYSIDFIPKLFAQRVPKLQAEDQAIWWDTLNKMQKILRKAAASLSTTGKIDKDQMHNYFMSGRKKMHEI